MNPSVRWYGEAEFWLASGKLLLIIILFFFTFITMVGGNPQGDAYGFRYWREPGAFAEYITTGSLGRFEGFLGSLFTAAWTVVGPEYIAMVSVAAALGTTLTDKTRLPEKLSIPASRSSKRSRPFTGVLGFSSLVVRSVSVSSFRTTTPPWSAFSTLRARRPVLPAHTLSLCRTLASTACRIS